MLTAILIALCAVNAFGQKVHTWHRVTSNSSAKCELGKSFEQEDFTLVSSDLKPLVAFNVSSSQPARFGLTFTDAADFNLVFTLTCIRADGQFAKSPKVVFVIGADGPADPDIRVLNYYGAGGAWKVVPGVGEDFFLTFP